MVRNSTERLVASAIWTERVRGLLDIVDLESIMFQRLLQVWYYADFIGVV